MSDERRATAQRVAEHVAWGVIEGSDEHGFEFSRVGAPIEVRPGVWRFLGQAEDAVDGDEIEVQVEVSVVE
jgi:hypothetical protein